jgi:carbon-monoxide dehydrogenase medium subunit
MGLETDLNLASDFELHSPETVASAVALLDESGDNTAVMAGGQSLTVLLTMGLAKPDVVVSLARCRQLVREAEDDGELELGAMFTIRAAERSPMVTRLAPMLALSSAKVGSPHVRNFGTVVGSLCHADPGGDLSPAAICLDARVVARSVTGVREIPLAEFHRGPYDNALSYGELATALRIPAVPNNVSVAYRKVVKRQGDLAIASVAVLLEASGRRVERARIAVSGLVTKPLRLSRLESEIEGSLLSSLVSIRLRDDMMSLISDHLLADPDDPTDEEYKRALAPRLVGQVIAEAAVGGGSM